MESSEKNQREQFRASKEVSVMAWIENQYGEVLILKQKRGNKLWTLPGGKVRQRESLKEALKREVEEEIDVRIQFVTLADLFDRPQKAVITFLYTARLKGHHEIINPKPAEIDAVKFSSSLPSDATPSLRFFWKRVHQGTFGSRRRG